VKEYRMRAARASIDASRCGSDAAAGAGIGRDPPLPGQMIFPLNGKTLISNWNTSPTVLASPTVSRLTRDESEERA
jgi:hypothetical protein